MLLSISFVCVICFTKRFENDGFRVGFGWFPGRLRVVSRSVPGGFRVDSGWVPGRLGVGLGSDPDG
jgi:hypothetical protein